MPRIAIDVRALVGTPTGIGVYTRALLAALSRRGGWELVGMAHRSPETNGWAAGAGVSVEVQPAPSGVLWQQLALPRRLARGDIDLLWSPLQTLPLAGRTPAVVTVHDLTALLLPETHRLEVRLSQAPFLERSLRRARRVVAVSEATAEDLRHFFPEASAKVRVVPNGVAPEFRPAGEEAVAETRRELGLPRGYLLYAGTLEPRKNVHRLVAAWEALRHEEQGALPLVLVGPYGWKSRALVRRLAALAPQGLRLLGRVEPARLVQLMQAATVFVYPSLYEGFGLPAAEAMACGVPVVASRAASLPEVVGDAGLLVDPEDAGELGGAIRHLLDRPDRRRELAARGLRRAAAFTWERAAETMDALFREALAPASAAEARSR
ncbi:MAG TPA: glycosyltransferase family 1 protein [Thermoanaerobaculia bacterium]|nr:glycosyltransferase family 1 protein [Thermoanaerobaculia bacterium]